LLKNDPSLAAIFFNFGAPQKIDIEAFMSRNYRFNVPLERFAFLTGRSLSAFKRDFQQIYNDTPRRWLTKKRLDEAYFLSASKAKSLRTFTSSWASKICLTSRSRLKNNSDLHLLPSFIKQARKTNKASD
jgi:AraC-like DNA-binding protein